MATAQDLRLILLLNNLVSLILGFIPGGNSWDLETISIVAAVFHLLSWLYNFWMICRSWWQRRAIIFKYRRPGSYQPLPTDADLDVDVCEGIARLKPQRSFCFMMLGMLFDMSFSISFLTLFIATAIRLNYAKETFVAVGDLVAAFVHGFFVLYAFRRMLFGKFTIEISLNVRDKAQRDDGEEGMVPKNKEQESRKEPQMQQSPPPQQPYRGSPSNKPSLQETGLIRLTDPVDTDALIGDHD